VNCCGGGGLVPPAALLEAFAAHKTANQINITGAVIVWEAVDIITPAFSWNAATNALTVRQSGLYYLSFVLQLELIATTVELKMRINGSNAGSWGETAAVAAAGLAIPFIAQAGDVVDTVFASSAIRDIINAASTPPLNKLVVWKLRDM
jgi:hypothetical protein